MSFANSVINAAAGQTAIWHDLRGINATVSAGAASGLQALAAGADAIHSGRADVLLAGGAEELCFESFLGFERAGRLCRADNGAAAVPVPLHARRNGFVLGEAAALLVLEERGVAEARGAAVLGEILGYGSAFDCTRGQAPERAAEAMADTVRYALDDAGADPGALDCASLSASGSVVGDVAEARGVAAVLGARAAELPVTAVKSMLGETLGAGGALQAIVALEALRNGVLPGIRGLDELAEHIPLRRAGPDSVRCDGRLALVTSFGLTGGHASMVLACGDTRREDARGDTRRVDVRGDAGGEDERGDGDREDER
jgi:3-oxoacyl-[acyl-carrier-protein] synthase II